MGFLDKAKELAQSAGETLEVATKITKEKTINIENINFFIIQTPFGVSFLKVVINIPKLSNKLKF